MKVKELIAKLETLDPNKDIYGLCESPEIINGKFVEVFSIESVGIANVTTPRDSNENPEFIFFPKNGGVENYFIYLTNDF